MKAKWEMLKEECIRQSLSFIAWDKSKKYRTFHSSHYDWWAFPIDKPSSYGEKYQVTSEQRSKLLLDPAFINALRTNAILVCRSWGYDLENGKHITTQHKDQRWQRWPIRLHKMSSSLELFQQWDLHTNSIKYGIYLINKGENFTYSGKQLDEYFRKWQNSGLQTLQKQGKTSKMNSQQLKYTKMQQKWAPFKQNAEQRSASKWVQKLKQPSQVQQDLKIRQIQSNRFKSLAHNKNNQKQKIDLIEFKPNVVKQSNQFYSYIACRNSDQKYKNKKF